MVCAAGPALPQRDIYRICAGPAGARYIAVNNDFFGHEWGLPTLFTSDSYEWKSLANHPTSD